jgi:peroxiredoxin
MKSYLLKFKKIVLTILLLVPGLASIAQNGDNCFNMMNLEDPPKLDSTLSKYLRDRDQQFYDLSINCKAPDFKVANMNGDTIELAKLKGKIVILNFWFIECGGCIAEIPDINKLVEEYKNKDVVFISMARNSKTELMEKFIPNHTLNSIIIPDCIQIANEYCVLGWPTTFILNKKGKLEKAFIGKGRIDLYKLDFYGRIKNIIDGLL